MWVHSTDGSDRAAHLLGQLTYSFGDDFKDYFNLLSVATPELRKLAQGLQGLANTAAPAFVLVRSK